MSQADSIPVPHDLERIGKYDVVEWIADGGFATLYKGWDPFLKRVVALKVCTSADGDLRQQFLREAEIAGRLDHPNVVRTFDFGFEGGHPYMVQEYLHGEDLWLKIERRAPLTLRHKLGLALQVAQGLAYSHDMGVLHLDVKPANVRVVEQGQAKILDFGIARLAQSDTQPGFDGMLGTAGYLPPEQVRGQAVDSRADVFAFGVLVYELFTYRRPFPGTTIPELIKNVLSGALQPMPEQWPECPDDLARLVHRCLEADREARYARFDEILPVLLEILPTLPAEEADPSWTADPALTGITSEPPDGAVPMVPVALETETPDELSEPAAEAEATPPTPLSQRISMPSPRGAVRWGVAAGVAALVSLAGIWTVRGPGQGEATAQEVVVAAEAGSEVAVAPGVLLVSALPWGEVRSVVEADRGEVSLPASRITPLRIELEPGSYAVEVSGPAGSEPWTCDARVAPGATHICHAALAEVSVTAYFKELGWWR
jgi:serine/threonine-protein kinase